MLVRLLAMGVDEEERVGVLRIDWRGVLLLEVDSVHWAIQTSAGSGFFILLFKILGMGVA